jgi:hypothetical protein
MHSSL